MMRTSQPAHPDSLSRFYVDVAEQAVHLERRHAGRLQCGRGCAACCKDGLSVLEIEAARIRERHAALLRDASPHPAGACAFLAADQSCRIYADRPYICRTQGLPLRWFDAESGAGSGETEQVVELRDICPLNLAGPPLEDLQAQDCWLLGPAEERLERLDEQLSTRPGMRVPLRSLFART